MKVYAALRPGKAEWATKRNLLPFEVVAFGSAYEYEAENEPGEIIARFLRKGDAFNYVEVVKSSDHPPYCVVVRN